MNNIDDAGAVDFTLFKLKRLWIAGALVFLVLGIGGAVVWWQSSRTGPQIEVHYRVFEIDAALADRLVPGGQRQTGATGNWELATVTPETLAALLDGRVLNHHVMMDRHCAVPARAGKTYVDTQKPGVSEPMQEIVTGWPLVTDNFGASLKDQVANDIALVDGHGYFGVRRQGGELELKTKYTLSHRIGSRPTVEVNIAFEGGVPQTEALAFLVPFARKDDTTGYYVLSVGVEQGADSQVARAGGSQQAPALSASF